MKSATVIISIMAIVALTVWGVVAYRRNAGTPIIYSPQSMIEATWQRYKDNYLEQGTYRALDRQRNNVTTSEGQSYTMLRAVWMDDHFTFDRSWQWTQDNLRQNDGYLFSWLFGQKSDGSYGILTDQRGQNTASDADTDIALALAFAYARWRDPKYLEASKNIVSDIWEQEVVIINRRPYMASDDVQKQFNTDIMVNPSYLAPYAYRIFKDIDPDHDWLGVVDTSYEVLESSMSLPLAGSTSAGLPPNWASLRRTDGTVIPPRQVPGQTGIDTNFGYDALRVPWRLALDWNWNDEPRAKRLLDSMAFLRSEWSTRRQIYDIYSHDGRPIGTNEVPAMYGGTIGSFIATNPALAEDLYRTELASLYNPDSNSWKELLGYYDDNWAWLGIALYHNKLPDLWATVQK